VQTRVITDGEVGAVLGIDASRILGSRLVLRLGHRQSHKGCEKLEGKGKQVFRILI